MTTKRLSGGTYDWGAAINRALDDMDRGDVLIIPAREYRTNTTAVIDVPYVTIRSERPTGRDTWRYTNPRIRSEGMSGPLVRTQSPAAICGLSFDGSKTRSNPQDAIEAHNSVEIRDINSTYMGRHTVHCFSETEGEGTNTSRIYNVSGKLNEGSVVGASAAAGVSRNTNAMEIYVRGSFQNYGYAVDIDTGIGNTIHVSQIEGSNHTAGVRLGDNHNFCHVSYMEGNINTGVVFDDNQNCAQVVYSGLADSAVFQDNGGNNRWRFLNKGIKGSSYENHRFEGTNIQHLTPGRGITLTSPDGLTTKTFGLRNDGTFGELI